MEKKLLREISHTHGTTLQGLLEFELLFHVLSRRNRGDYTDSVDLSPL